MVLIIRKPTSVLTLKRVEEDASKYWGVNTKITGIQLYRKQEGERLSQLKGFEKSNFILRRIWGRRG